MAQPNNSIPSPSDPLRAEPLLPSITILDAIFPGFSYASSNAQQMLSGNLSSYAHIMCFWGLLAFFGTYLEKVWVLLQTHFTSTVYVKHSDEVHDMVLAWVSHQNLDSAARSSLARVQTKLRGHKDRENGIEKSLSYSPWNGGFIFRHKSNFLSYRTALRDFGLLRKEEQIAITCLGRSSKPLKDFLDDCREKYLELVKNKTSIFQHRGDRWHRTTSVNARPLSTVILNENEKQPLIKDIEGFLSPETREWYSQHSMPYRRGYLFHGPPGTGKTSLCLSVAGRFRLDVYCIDISNVTDEILRDLFSELPPQCVVLLEDIDAAWTAHGRTKTENEEAAEPDAFKSKNAVTLSGLLNIIDGVASQEGRVLIMTTNHIEKLDKALIRPGRVDRGIKFQLADHDVVTQLYRFVFLKPDDAHSGKLSPDKPSKIDKLADEFAALIPELVFSPAELLSFLVQHKDSSNDMLKDVQEWVDCLMQEKESQVDAAKPREKEAKKEGN